MRFLHKATIDISKVPKYPIFNTDFAEEIDQRLANIIVEDIQGLLPPESKVEFSKMVARVNNGVLPVKYSPRVKGYGRRYADIPKETFPDGKPNPNFKKYYSALISMPRKIKNTLYHYQGFRDYDQVKGHPTILCEIANRIGEGLVPTFEEFVKAGRFDEIAKDLIEYHTADPENPLTKRDIKWLFNKTIYGGGFKQWVKDIEKGDAKNNDPPKPVKNADKKHKFYEEFYNESQFLINMIYNANKELTAIVCDEEWIKKKRLEDPDIDILWCKKNAVMSCVCGIIENEITFRAYEFACDNGMCVKYTGSWALDGFTIKYNGYDEADMLERLNAYVRDKTGFNRVRFIRKEFDDEEILHTYIDMRNQTPVAQPVPLEAVAVEGNEYLKWKTEFEKEWCKIKNTASFIREYKINGVFDKYVIHDERRLVSAYKHDCYERESNGKIKSVPCVMEWLSDKNMRCYDEAQVYPPPLVCPPNVYNLWRPFKYESQPITAEDPDFDMEAVRLFAEHLETMCNNDLSVSNYLSCWIAHAFQVPSIKPECAITLIGKQGVGKSTITGTISRLMGTGRTLETSTPERDCWGNHNAPMTNAYLVILSETDKKNLGVNGEKQLKKLITDHARDGGYLINPKGRDQFGINSYHRVIQDTNSADPTITSEDDRRNLIIRCSDEKKGDTKYFTALYEALERPNALRSIYWSFRTMDISDWDFRDIPKTKYHKTIIEGNRNPLETFMEHFTILHKDKEFVDYFGKDMLTLFKSWREKTNCAYGEKLSDSTLITHIQLQLNLNENVITKLPRSSAGQKRRYSIGLLKDHFNLTNDLITEIENQDTDENSVTSSEE